jgi:outer membrane protein TolC
VRVEDARFQQSLVAYRDTVLRASQEVEDALAGS